MSWNRKKSWAALMIVLVFAFQGVAFATDSLIISQIVQTEQDVTIYANLINAETDTVVNESVTTDNLEIRLDAGAPISPNSVTVFNGSGEGISYVVVVDQNVKLVTYSNILAQYKKALQELRASLGEKDQIKIIFAGKKALSAFPGNSSGFTSDFSQVDSAIADIRNDNRSSRPVLLESIQLAIDSFRSRQKDMPERHVIVVFTMGKDASSYQVDELKTAAADAGVPLYVIGLDGGDGAKADLEEVGKIARSSGGQLFDAKKYSDPVQAVNRMNSEIRGTFIIRVRPDYAYFGNATLNWSIRLNAADRVIDSNTYTHDLSAIVTATPIPTATPTAVPTTAPTAAPTAVPTMAPTVAPTVMPTTAPTTVPASPLQKLISSPQGLLMIIVLVLALVATMTVVAIRKKKEATGSTQEDWDNDSSSQTPEEPQQPDDKEQTQRNPFSGLDDTISLFGSGEETMNPNSQRREMQLRFVISYDGSSTERTMPIGVHDKLVFGREPSSTIVLEDRSASRKHCTVTYRDNALYLDDAGSSFGTTLNGQRVVSSVLLKNGDHFRVGNTDITLAVLQA